MYFKIQLSQSAGAVEYTDCTSAEDKIPPMSVLNMTQNNLMVKFHKCWGFGVYGEPLHCHCSQINSGPAW